MWIGCDRITIELSSGAVFRAWRIISSVTLICFALKAAVERWYLRAHSRCTEPPAISLIADGAQSIGSCQFNGGGTLVTYVE